ncbi:MAG TPA: Rnf-Nqr domain containing protein [Methylotenera sp.]|nr:Rnf-Nqr domain containing protein [Methylotenera sp.]
MSNLYKEITINVLWKQNSRVVQLLGLCSTLALTKNAVNGLSLGLAATLVMAAATDLGLVLGLLGAMHELVGRGTLFSGLDLVFGAAAVPFMLTVIPSYHGFLLAVLPPAAFLGLGIWIAVRN